MTIEEKEQKRQEQIRSLAADAGIPLEYLELLQQGFKENDFTIGIPLPARPLKLQHRRKETSGSKQSGNESADAAEPEAESAVPSDETIVFENRSAYIDSYYSVLFEAVGDALPALGKEISTPIDEALAQRLFSDQALAKQHQEMRELIIQYMRACLPGVGFKRDPGNFTGNHPAMLLMDADAEFISEKVVEITQDSETVNDVVELFCDLFAPQIDAGAKAYCAETGKQEAELKTEDWQTIFDRVTNVVNETLLESVMHGQQFPALAMDARKNPTHEDFGNKRNRDAINFFTKWNHINTEVGLMLSLDDLTEVPAFDGDSYACEILNAFCDQLSDTDAAIFRMRGKGCKVEDIARALNYKNHSPVSKRMKKMKQQWAEFKATYQPE